VFTGIVTGLGRVAAVERRGKRAGVGRRQGGARIRIEPPRGFGRLSAGESVCVAGVCLTAVASGRGLAADLSPETLRRSRLGSLRPGDRVNLERALRWGDRLSGHFVMGHVDGLARVLSVERAGNSRRLRFSIPRGQSRFVVPKGSVALDGVSLTVAARRRGGFDVAVIRETLRRTTLGRARAGERVHFEADIFARYGRRGSLRVLSRDRKR
jgi:riboflavin synthase